MAAVDYKAEKAASEARKAKVYADAEVEFDRWYKDLGTRAELHTLGHAGTHYGRVLTTSAKCWCGKATAALGLCETHYSQFWRKHYINIGLRNRTAICHPDRNHFRKGLCYECFKPELYRSARYFKTSNKEKNFLLSLTKVPKASREVRILERKENGRDILRSEVITAPRKAWKCKHRDRPHDGYGVCKPCNKKRQRLVRGEIHNTRLPPKKSLITICGHKPDLTQKEAIIKGFCRKCYKREQMRLWRRKKKGRRKPGRLPHNPPIFCGHPERKHHAKHCCKNCYYSGKWKQPGFLIGKVA